MESNTLRIKTAFVSVLRPIICTGKKWGVSSPKGGKLKKCHASKNFQTLNFGGCFIVDLPSILCIVCHDTLLSECTKNVGQKYRR